MLHGIGAYNLEVGPASAHVQLGELTSPADMSAQWGTATAGMVIWRIAAGVSAVASAYHGYKRHGDSIGWGIAWFLLGGLFPVITPGVAVIQGFGKRRKGR